MKKILLGSVLFFMTISVWSQSKKKKEINSTIETFIVN